MPVKNGIGGRPSLVEAASALAVPERERRAKEWPYPWTHPPFGSQHVNKMSVTQAPANATLTELLSYTVPDAYFFRLSGILLTYASSIVSPNLVDGLGQVVWNLDVNIPTSIGGTLTAPVLPSGYRVKDFGVINFHLGSADNGPWQIPGKLTFDPRDMIRAKVTTTAPFPGAGAPIAFLASFVGWLWPIDHPDY